MQEFFFRGAEVIPDQMFLRALDKMVTQRNENVIDDTVISYKMKDLRMWCWYCDSDDDQNCDSEHIMQVTYSSVIQLKRGFSS